MRLADSLEPPPRQTVSEWAGQNRRLSSDGTLNTADKYLSAAGEHFNEFTQGEPPGGTIQFAGEEIQ